MKQFSKAMIVSSIVAASLAAGGVASADRGGRGMEDDHDRGQHRGWFKPAQMMKFIDQKDNDTNIEMKKDGTVALRGAKVTAIASNAVTVTETLGSVTLTWTITTDGTTKFESKNGQTITLTDIAVGDTVTVKGAMQTGSSLAVKATLIRDISKAITPAVVNAQQTFEGTLTVLPGAALPTTLTMNIGSTPQVVNLSNTTVVLNKDWTATTLSTFVAGDTVRVFGFIPSGSTAITGVVVRNTTR